MRVSNSLITRTLSARLLQQQSLLAEAQDRVATGKKVQKMSDDPAAGTAIMQASGSLRGIGQYARNVENVIARLDAEDSALNQLSEIMGRAKELAVATLGSTSGTNGRRAAGAELRQLIGQVVNIANQKVGDEFLFGGTNNDGRDPFTPVTTLPNGTRVFVPTDGPPAAPIPREPTGDRFIEIAAGQTMRGAHAGKAVFLDTGVLAALDELATAMESDDTVAMGAATVALESAFAGVQTFVGEIGARQNQADTIRAGLAALEDTFTTQKSSLSEVEMEEAITEMLQRQTAYQAAMLASSKVMGLSLTDYIR